MPTQSAAWGIEIGAHAIKAIRLERDGDTVSVGDFAVIPHKKVLTSPDLDKDEMIRLSLGQFISQKNLEGEHLVMSVPGHAAFARFAKLPPVEPKKVPDIVKFEAVQQIPFPIDQVEWDYETFTMADSPEIEVGIFAITRDRVQQMLGLYAELGLGPEALTLSPVAVFNAMSYDHDLKKNTAPVIYLDIGTQATDVVIAEEGRCWIRTFPLGGTHFTEAIASSFKVSYSKAEKLKLEASSSKYAKQIMQAMRPVFSDLLQDLQRSIGYYQSLHREHELTTMVGLGSTFKIPGLRKFLGQQLQINVVRLDEFKRISMTGREAAAFAENAVNMATAYGLALQGVGLASIDANLVPVKSLREQMWHSKTKWFAAAAVLGIIAGSIPLYRPLIDRAHLREAEPPIVRQVLDRGGSLKQQYEALRSQPDAAAGAKNMIGLVSNRDLWGYLLKDASTSLRQANPQPELLGSDPEAILAIDPRSRRLVELRNLDGQYRLEAGTSRRIRVVMDVQLSHSNPIEFLNETVAKWLRENAERPDVPYRILVNTISVNPGQLREIQVGDPSSPDRPLPGAPTPAQPPRRDGGFGDPTPGPGSGPGPSPIPSGGGIGGPIPPPNDPAPTPRRAPGWHPGGLGDGAAPPPSPTPTPQRPGVPTPPRPGDDGQPDRERARRNLEEMAPSPIRPMLFPPGSRYYHVPVTFEIELIGPSAGANEEMSS